MPAPALLSICRLGLLLILAALPGMSFGAEPESVDRSPAQCPPDTLCTRLGGPQGLDEIAGKLLTLTFADPRTAPQWEGTDIRRVRRKLGEYLCVLTGGSCVYDDDDLRAIHAGHHVQQAQFYAMVEHLRHVLDERGVSTRDKNALLALLAPTRRDVVEP